MPVLSWSKATKPPNRLCGARDRFKWWARRRWSRRPNCVTNSKVGVPASQRVRERLRFTRLGFEVLTAYMEMVHAAATEGDYAAAVAAGERGLAAREQLADMNLIFTTYRGIGEKGYSWWPGEVLQYRELLPYINGQKGELVAACPWFGTSAETLMTGAALRTGLFNPWTKATGASCCNP